MTAQGEPAASYDLVAEAFDRWSERLSAPFAERALALAELRPGARALDVGTGTGLVALRAARQVVPGGSVVGIDVSDAMLAVASRKAPLADAVAFHKMDAHALQFPAACFDAVISLFALRHCVEPLTALREMRRVLRPGGRVVVAVGSPPPLLSRSGIVRALQRLSEGLRELRGLELQAPRALDTLVRDSIPAPRPCHPGQTSLRLEALVREAGLEEARSCWKGCEAAIASPEEFWELQRTISTFARERLAGAGPELVEAARRELLAASRRVLSRGGRLVFRLGALFVSARRPPEPRD